MPKHMITILLVEDDIIDQMAFGCPHTSRKARMGNICKLSRRLLHAHCNKNLQNKMNSVVQQNAATASCSSAKSAAEELWNIDLSAYKQLTNAEYFVSYGDNKH